MHINRRHTSDGESFDCPECGASYKVKDSLSKHIHRAHRVHKHACTWPHCPKTFATHKELTDHINRHLDVKNHRCPHCTHAYSTENSLSTHIKRSHAERAFACRDCPLRFSFKGDLRHHLQRCHHVQGRRRTSSVHVKPEPVDLSHLPQFSLPASFLKTETVEAAFYEPAASQAVDTTLAGTPQLSNSLSYLLPTEPSQYAFSTELSKAEEPASSSANSTYASWKDATQPTSLDIDWQNLDLDSVLSQVYDDAPTEFDLRLSSSFPMTLPVTPMDQ
jgi:uncharacterized C2H2 Zn-finger protein